jgi:hypothetical protein
VPRRFVQIRGEAAMKTRVLTLVVLVAVWSLAACTGQVVVQAQVQDEEGNPMALRDLVVRALPYDRDAIFDSLRAIHPAAEPIVPDSVWALQDSIARANTAYANATARWGTARDSLKTLSDILQRTPRASAQYRVMFQDFAAQEDVERSTKRQMDGAFAQLTRLNDRFGTQASEMRARREAWAEEAYAAVDSVIFLKLRELNRTEAADTTDGNGVARFSLKTGAWWIHARYDLPFQEMYWNVPVEVTRGDPIVVQLERTTSQLRPKL